MAVSCGCLIQKNCGRDLSTHPDWLEARKAIAVRVARELCIDPDRVHLEVMTNCKDLAAIAMVRVEGWTHDEQRRAWKALDSFLHAKWGYDCWVEKPWLHAWFHEHPDQTACRAA